MFSVPLAHAASSAANSVSRPNSRRGVCLSNCEPAILRVSWGTAGRMSCKSPRAALCVNEHHGLSARAHARHFGASQNDKHWRQACCQLTRNSWSGKGVRFTPHLGLIANTPSIHSGYRLNHSTSRDTHA
jgi:hypothetical protein